MKGDKTFECVPVKETTPLPLGNVTQYEHIQKCMVKFLSKVESGGIKIARIDSICILKFINLLLFVECHCLSVASSRGTPDYSLHLG